MTQMVDVCEIPVHVLNAHFGIAPKEDTRYYLKGVFVDIEHGRLVSTDGICLLVTRQEMAEKAPRPSSFILKRELIEAALKKVRERGKRRAVKRIIVQVGADSSVPVRETRLLIELTRDGILSDTEIDGRYPEYERVVPRTLSGTHAVFNPMQLARMHQALALAENVSVEEFLVALLHNGPFSGIMVGSERALGVLVPWDGEPRKPNLKDISLARTLENLRLNRS